MNQRKIFYTNEEMTRVLYKWQDDMSFSI